MNDRKILFVDEEKWYIEAIFDRIVEEFGEGCYDHAYDGFGALELLKKQNYSAIVLDMMLPLGGDLNFPNDNSDKIPGIFILKKIREADRFVPIICYTILDETYIKKQIIDWNATHICKLEGEAYDKLFVLLRNIFNA